MSEVINLSGFWHPPLPARKTISQIPGPPAQQMCLRRGRPFQPVSQKPPRGCSTRDSRSAGRLPHPCHASAGKPAREQNHKMQGICTGMLSQWVQLLAPHQHPRCQTTKENWDGCAAGEGGGMSPHRALASWGGAALSCPMGLPGI